MNNKNINTAVKKASPLLLSLLLSACVSNASESSDTTITEDVKVLEKSSTLIQERSLESTPPQIGLSKMTKSEQLEHCKNDLAKQLSLDVEKISVLTTRRVTWRSGALGCPEEGVAYTQAQVPGRIIALAAGDEVYRYHSAVNETPFLCPNSRAESPVVNPGDL